MDVRPLPEAFPKPLPFSARPALDGLVTPLASSGPPLDAQAQMLMTLPAEVLASSELLREELWVLQKRQQHEHEAQHHELGMRAMGEQQAPARIVTFEHEPPADMEQRHEAAQARRSAAAAAATARRRSAAAAAATARRSDILAPCTQQQLLQQQPEQVEPP